MFLIMLFRGCRGIFAEASWRLQCSGLESLDAQTAMRRLAYVGRATSTDLHPKSDPEVRVNELVNYILEHEILLMIMT